MKQIKYILVLILVLSALVNAQTTTSWIIRVEVPANTPLDANIYIAGNFNGWNPADPNFKLSPYESGLYALKVTVDTNDVEFKFTLGSWEKVEVLANHKDRNNRLEKLEMDGVVGTYKVQAWADREKKSTITGNVQVIENFYMPQLDRYRRLWIYLPPGYDKGNKKYPVLYMHDGQNLFSDATSFSGEWGVDETLEELISQKKIPKMIVVGIENSQYRMSEYAPFFIHYLQYEIDGEAQEYGKFLVETLKPYIDKKYRTKPGRKTTALAGSSMGGLVSTFLGIKYQEVFSKVGALSSSFGVCRDEMIEFIKQNPKKHPMRIWMDIGSEEAGYMELNENQIPVKIALIEAGWIEGKEVKFKVFEGAKHNESYWRERFDEALLYLFK